MTEAEVIAPPAEGTREDLVRYYLSLLATPHNHANCAELRRRGRDGLTLLGALPVAAPSTRRRLSLVSTYFRAPRPKGRLTRI
jgi:hypothetical protein